MGPLGAILGAWGALGACKKAYPSSSYSESGEEENLSHDVQTEEKLLKTNKFDVLFLIKTDGNSETDTVTTKPTPMKT